MFQKIYSANPQAEYAQRLLAAHREAVQKASILEDRKKGKLAYMEDGGETRNASLIEPLTRREMEIMQLIAEGYSNKEIAQKLYISPRTVKFYATGIYSKLGVTGRTQAVYRARELGLLQ